MLDAWVASIPRCFRQLHAAFPYPLRTIVQRTRRASGHRGADAFGDNPFLRFGALVHLQDRVPVVQFSCGTHGVSVCRVELVFSFAVNRIPARRMVGRVVAAITDGDASGKFDLEEGLRGRADPWRHARNVNQDNIAFGYDGRDNLVGAIRGDRERFEFLLAASYGDGGSRASGISGGPDILITAICFQRWAFVVLLLPR